MIKAYRTSAKYYSLYKFGNRLQSQSFPDHTASKTRFRARMRAKAYAISGRGDKRLHWRVWSNNTTCFFGQKAKKMRYRDHKNMPAVIWEFCIQEHALKKFQMLNLGFDYISRAKQALRKATGLYRLKKEQERKAQLKEKVKRAERIKKGLAIAC